MSKNKEKHDSYRYSFEQMKAAIKAGFFLEAVMIQESIIADRLLSVLVKGGHFTDRELHRPPTLATLVKKSSELSTPFPRLRELDEWRLRRNEVAHAIAKSLPGMPTIASNQFRRMAKTTAAEGESICKDLKKWSRASRGK